MDQDVVHVDGNISFVNEFAEKVVHHQLEGGRGVCKAEEHNHWFEQTVVRLECGLPFIAIAHSNVIVTPADIQLRKER